MGEINQAQFQFDQTFGAFIGLMTAVMVFGVALDLKWEQFRRILKSPKAPGIGLLGQFVILPAVAFLIGLTLTDEPSVALGLLLVASCPGGAVSNYLTHLGKGDVPTSISMTAVSTITCLLMTPLLFTSWASLNPEAWALMQEVQVDPKMVAIMFFVTVVLPVGAGMSLRARRSALTKKLRPWIGRISALLFATVVVMAFSRYFELVLEYAKEALLPVTIVFTIAVGLGWALARLIRLNAAERRAVVIEVGGQNVAIGAMIAVTFFPSHAGVFVMVATWGTLQQIAYVSLVALWSQTPPKPAQVGA